MSLQRLSHLKSEKALLIFIYSLALVCRMIFARHLRIGFDEGIFLSIAIDYNITSLIDGIFMNFAYHDFSSAPLNQPPLVSIQYTILYSFFPKTYLFGRIMAVILSSFCVILIYYSIKNIWDYKAGLVGAFLVAIDISFSMAVLMDMDSLTSFIFCFTCFAISKVYSDDSLKWHIFSGFCFGLCMLTKWNLVVLPLLYVFLYSYRIFLKRNQLSEREKLTALRNITCSAGTGLAIFLPWFFLMGAKGYLPILFGHTKKLKLQTVYEIIYLMWRRSPFLVILGTFAFLFYFLKNKDSRIPLLGFPFILLYLSLMPRYHDFSVALYLFVILAAKPTTLLVEKTLENLLELINQFQGLNTSVDVKPTSALLLALICLSVGLNSMYYQDALWEQNRTVQNTAEYVKSIANENTIVICTPEFGALLYPRKTHYINFELLREGYFLIYTPLYESYTTKIIRKGVASGVCVTIENRTVFFDLLKEIDDVSVYRLYENSTISNKKTSYFKHIIFPSFSCFPIFPHHIMGESFYKSYKESHNLKKGFLYSVKEELKTVYYPL
ncbi:MAG: ArnT family glycosyltransferase [Candidatus Hermodarchaeota archaeon]